MSRKYSEGEVRTALADMDLDLFVYKPPDSPGPYQSTKPADFMVWWMAEGIVGTSAMSAWIEVKSTPAIATLGANIFEASQLAGMRRAKELGLRYLVAVHWTRHKRWTITTGDRVLARLDDGRKPYLRGDMPIDCTPSQLPGHLRAALLGEIDS